MDISKRWQNLKRMQPREVWDHLLLLMSVPKYRKIAWFSLIAAMAFIAADSFSLVLDDLVPEPPPVLDTSFRRENLTTSRATTYAKYKDIVARDLFSAAGTIPDEGISSGIAQRTRLPFKLIGVVYFEDSAKSIAAVQDSSLNRIFPVQVGDSILDKANIEKIEEYRVVFTNRQNGNLEYVEMPHKDFEFPISSQFQPSTLSAVRKATDGINQLDETHYQIERSTIDKQMANLNDILQQARAIPNFENGMLNGYKILQVTPGSIYEQLGIHNGDVITSFNGNAVTDSGKALALLNDLRNQSQVSLNVKRGGVPMTLNYSLK